jgi:flagellar hook-associated protein 3 FlgL
MITNLDGASELFLADLGRIQDRVAAASRQVSSGKKISSASDAPDEIEPLLRLRAALQRNSQIKSNLALASTEVDGADLALASAIKVMDRARTLAAKGANSPLDAASRQSIAAEVQSLQEEMISLACTTVQGRYIFGGDADDGAPYKLDLTAPEGVLQLSSAAATRRIEDPAGGSFSAAKTAQEIFDPRLGDGTAAPDNVFAALNGLRLALLNNDVNAVSQSAAAISQASDRLNACEAFYGSVQRRIADATAYASSYDLQLKKELSQKEDADAVAAALELMQANTQLQATMQMRSKLPSSSLFDYLG